VTSADPVTSAATFLSIIRRRTDRNFQVKAENFSTYSGILQIGLPRRIDVLNRADGITFDEAVC